MSGFTEHQASGASDVGRRHEAVLTWSQAQEMMPLVGRIVADIIKQVQRLARLEPEKARLDRHRNDLVWPERQRRYQLADEIILLNEELQHARAELDSLGVLLLDEEEGVAGFPTLVNNQRAYFSWKPGETSVDFWQFADSARRRPVPTSWKQDETLARRK
jgi:hypothetical protein